MIDLHLHTVHSDGTDSVEMLLKNAEKKKLEIISITDHNSVGAYYEFEENPKLRDLFSGKILVGSELKTTYKKVNIEVLAYGIDFKKINIVRENQEQVQQEAMQHFKTVAQRLGLKFDKTIEPIPNDVSKQFAGDVFSEEILKYPENMEIINKIGIFYHRNSMGKEKVGGPFYRVHESNPNSPFYFDTSKYYRNIDDLIDDIHNAGGLAFLAHGFEYTFENKEKTIEEILTTTKLDGAECEYPQFTNDQRQYLKSLCKKYNKYMSGGSDYHALNKPNICMGTGINNNLKIDKSMVNDWINLKSLKWEG
jgi:hypothetical protein